jgi:hypothetical protein
LFFRLTCESAARKKALHHLPAEAGGPFRSRLRAIGKLASMQTSVRKFSCFFKGPSCYFLLLGQWARSSLGHVLGRIEQLEIRRSERLYFFLLFTGTSFRSDFARLPIPPLNASSAKRPALVGKESRPGVPGRL